jgi:hypothetical protein
MQFVVVLVVEFSKPNLMKRERDDGWISKRQMVCPLEVNWSTEVGQEYVGETSRRCCLLTVVVDGMKSKKQQQHCESVSAKRKLSLPGVVHEVGRYSNAAKCSVILAGENQRIGW